MQGAVERGKILVKELALAGVSGLLLALTLPPFNITGLVWVGLIPLLLVLWGGKLENEKRWTGFGRGYVAGLVFWVICLSWIGEVAVPGWWVVAALLACYFGFFGLFAVKVGNPWKDQSREAELTSWQSSRRSLWYALLCGLWWCGLEWIRGWFLTGFGWNGLGIAFHETPVLAQSADLVGAIGLAFLPVFASAIFLQVAVRLHGEVKRGKMRPHWDFGIMVMVIALAFFYGVLRLQSAREGEWTPVRVLLVQLNIPQEASRVIWPKEDVHAGYEDETLKALAEIEEQASAAVEKALEEGKPAVANLRAPDWVVWPEAALKEWLLTTDDGVQATGETNINTFSTVMPAGQHHLLFGVNEITADEDGDQLIPKEDADSYNTLTILRQDRDVFESYRKQHLVLFGETIPLRDVLPFLDDIFSKVAGVQFGKGFSSGTRTTPMVVPVPNEGVEVAVIPSICFEDTVPRHPRKFVKNGGQVIVNVTNDGWFKESAAAGQHFANARFRCIELRRPMVRCSNTGVSAVVNHIGGVEDLETGKKQVLLDETGSNFTRGSLLATVQVPVEGEMSLYARFGDWFGVLGVLVGFGLWGKRWSGIRKSEA